MALTIKPEWLKRWPPGGWRFQQPLPGNLGSWHAPDPLVNTFRQQVGNIVKWRKANPVIAAKLKLSTDWDVVSKELIDQNVARLLRIPKGDYYLYDSEQVAVQEDKKKASLWAFVKRGVAAAAEGVTAIANGETPLQEWLGEGGVPVERELAEARAGVCRDCPQNTRRHWTLFFTKPVAALFAKSIELKHEMKLSTSHDKELGACQACGCVLELKVHCPMAHIEAHTKVETWAKLDPRCWMLSERSRS